MTELDPRDDRMILDLLDGADRGGGTPREREYRELLGLLPWALEPVLPEPASKERLLRRIGAREVANPPLRHPATRQPAAWRRFGLLPLAAALAVALLGVSGWLTLELSRQRVQVEELARRLEASRLQMSEVSSLRAELTDLREKFRLVSGPGVEICALRAVGDQPVMPEARGVLFMTPSRSRWFLTLEGLDPCPEGNCYQVWFIADGGPVSAGTFDVREGMRVELSSDRVPPGVRGVAVTLERIGGAERPTGPRVLFGDRVMAVL